MPANLSTTNKQMQTRTGHFSRDTISALQIVLPNWYTLVGVETGVGAVATVTASVEYPSGTFTQILFSGSASGTIADGAQLLSDLCTIAIPKDTQFWIRVYYTNTAGIPYTSCQQGSVGDVHRIGASGIVDQTMSGTITNNSGGTGYFPAAILGYTRRASVFLAGDSRTFGQGDTSVLTPGDQGELARSIGPTLAYVNCGIPSERANFWATASNVVNRRAIAAYCSHVVMQHGINDLAAARTDAQLRTDINTMAAYFAGKTIFLTTLAPETTSTDSWATTANQTAVANFSTAGNGRRETHNAWRRTVPSGFTACFEIADVVESARDSGKWQVDGTASKYTADGVHATTFAYSAIVSSGAVLLAAIHR